MNKKVTLINPEFKRKDTVIFPIGLGYLAAACVRSGIEVENIDVNAMKLTREQVGAKIGKSGGRIVGITGLITQLKASIQMAGYIKKKFPESIIVLGGAQVSGCERIIMAHPEIDVIFQGEAEENFPEFVRRISDNRDYSDIKGLILRKNGDVVFNGDPVFIENVDLISRPLYELFPIEKYIKHSYLGIAYKRTCYIQGSRGCPYKCIYCINSKKKFKPRYRSVQNIINEIRFLKDRYRVNDILFMDEDILLNKEWLWNLMEKLENENLTWSAHCRADSVDDYSLKRMKKSGCQRVVLGLESGSDQILKSMNKRTITKRYKSSISAIRRNGIIVQPNFMIGMPDESKRTILETEEFCLENGLIYATTYVTPLPGTVLYDQMAGVIKNDNEYAESLYSMDYERFPMVNLSKIPTPSLLAYRRSVLVNTAAQVIFRRLKIVPKCLVKMACRAYVLFWDQAYRNEKLGSMASFITNIFRYILIPKSKS